MKNIFIILMVMLTFSCSGINISPKEKTESAYKVGYLASYLVFKNNPGYRITIKPSIVGAIKLIDTEEIDVKDLADAIYEYAKILTEDETLKDAKEIADAVELFSVILSMELSLSEDQKEAMEIIRAFLSGALDGLEKGE